MARQTNAIATGIDIQFAIDNDILLERLDMFDIYTNKCVTKEIVVGSVFLNESTLSGLTNNQLVKWDLLQSAFATSLTSITYASAGGTFPYKIASQNGFTSAESASWFSISPTTGASGVVNFDLIIGVKTTVGDRNATITFTENTTLATIVITVTQQGIAAPAPANQAVELFSSNEQSEICSPPTSATYYIPNSINFDTSTVLYINLNGSTNAPSGFYTQVLGTWRQWNGTAFINEGSCD